MLTDDELRHLQVAARAEHLPLGTVAYRAVAAWLERRV
jgi:hypothetical protein